VRIFRDGTGDGLSIAEACFAEVEKKDRFTSVGTYPSDMFPDQLGKRRISQVQKRHSQRKPMSLLC